MIVYRCMLLHWSFFFFFLAMLCNLYDVTELHLFATFNGRLFSAKSETEITALGGAFQNPSTVGFRNIFKGVLKFFKYRDIKHFVEH